jgi:hypothetical protein
MRASPTAHTISWPPGQSITWAVVESVPFFCDDDGPVAACTAVIPITT